jgi:hypothetical protein
MSMTTWISREINHPQGSVPNAAFGDITEIGLRRLGYRPFNLRRQLHIQDWTPQQTDKYLDGMFAGFDHGDTLIYLYPSWNYPTFDRNVLRRVKAHRDAQIVLVIMDFVPLQFAAMGDLAYIMATVNLADVLVAPAPAMVAWLRENGLKTDMRVVYQELLDFLPVADERPLEPPVTPTLAYIGDVTKVDSLLHQDDFSLAVWGKGDAPANLGAAVSWRGLFVQKVDQLPWGYVGLVWTDDEKFVAADLPNYGKINIPYKLSLYLASGIPVIVQAGSHAADVVQRFGVGVAVTSLQEISPVMAETDWDAMRSVVSRVRELVRGGRFTQAFLIQAEMALAEGGQHDEVDD